MAFDPNLYAIQLEMGIDSTQAASALNDVERQAVNVEQAINKAMNATLTQAAAQVEQINAQLEMTNTSVTDFGVQQALNIEKFDDHVKEHLKYTKEMEDQLDLYKEIRDLYSEQNDAFKLSSEVQKVIDKNIQQQSKSIKALLTDSVKAYLGFDTGKKTVKATGEEVDRTTLSHNKFETALHKIDGAFQKLSNTVQGYLTWFLKLTEATERFHTVNNRTYGSMHEIVGQAQLTALTFGLMTDKALEATEALINIGVAKESLEELTVALVKTNRVTGLTFESLAELVRQYEATGEGVAAYEQTIENVMAAQRSFNLSVGQTQKVLDLHNSTLFKSSTIFGKDAPAAILKSMLAMQAMTRDVGLGADTLDNYHKLLTASGAELLEIQGQMGGNPFGTITEKGNAILSFYDEYAKRLNAVGEENSANYQALATNYEAEMKSRGLDMNMILMFSKMRRQNNLIGMDAVQIQELYAKRLAEGLTITGEYEEGMKGLNAQWNRLVNAVTTALAPLVSFIADGMWPWLVVAQKIISVIYIVISAFVKLHQFFERIVPGLRIARIAVQLLIGGILLLTGGVIILSAAVAALIVGFISWAVTMGTVAAALFGLGGSIGKFFTGAAVSINTFLLRVTAGLGRIGAMLMPLIGPMLAFGAAVLMVGAGAFLLAKAFETVYQFGVLGMIMFNAFLTLILAFGLVIVGLGYLAIGAAPGLLALGAAILMIGAGVALMAGSMALLINAFTGLLNAISLDIGIRIVSLTNGLIYLAFWGPVIAVGLGLIGVALASMIVPLGLAVLAFVAISTALSMISDFKVAPFGEEINKFAIQILDASGKLLVAGAQLLIAAPMLLAGSVLLLASVVALGAASSLMMVVGSLLVASSSVFLLGAGLFYTGSVLFKSGSDNMAVGAAMLLSSAVSIPIATALLASGAVELAVVAAALVPGAIALGVASVAIFAAGLALLAASPSLIAGGIAFWYSASSLASGIVKLDKSSIILARFANAAKTISTLSFSGMRQGINDLGASALDIDKYITDMQKASVFLQDAKFDVDGFTGSITVASVALTDAAEKLQTPIDKLTSKIDSIILQSNRLNDQGQKISQLGSGLQMIDVQKGVNDFGNSMSEINKLSADAELNDLTQGIGGVESAMSRINQLGATTDISKFIQGVENVESAMSRIDEIGSNIDLSKFVQDIEAVSNALFNINELSANLNFGGVTKGINELGASTDNINKYVSDMERASTLLQNVRFDVSGFTDSILSAADALTTAAQKLQIPIDKLSSGVDELVSQISKIDSQESKINELGSNLSSAMPDKPEDLQQPAEFKKADGQTDLVNNIVEVKNDSSEIVALLKRLVVLAEGEKEVKTTPESNNLMTSSSPSKRLRDIGIEI